MKQVICIGSACKDIFFPTDEGMVSDTPSDVMSQRKITFELGAKYKIEDRAEAIGGVAANVAIGMAKLGLSPACYSHIGDDSSAQWIEKELARNGVDISLISREKFFSSDLSAIVVDKKSGDRVIFSNQKANGRMKIVPEKLKDAEWIFIGDLHGEWEKHLDDVCAIAKEKKIRVANNPRQANIHDNPRKVLEIISDTQVLFVNKDESIEILSALPADFSKEDLNNELFLVKKLKDLGPEVVAITDGVRGAWAIDGKEVVFAPGIKVEAKDTTGAGDSFSSAFFSAYIKGKSLSECVKWGIANSASEVQFYGSVEGLLSENEIEERSKTVEAKAL